MTRFLPYQMHDLTLSLDNAFHAKGWHGPTLLGSIRGISPADALFTPRPLKHNIWQIVLHAAYWKYAVCYRISKLPLAFPQLPTDANGKLHFPRSPSNCPKPPHKPELKAWRADIELLKLYHSALSGAVERLTDKQLESIPPGGKSWKLRGIIAGAAAHDAYHTGQIQILKRLI